MRENFKKAKINLFLLETRWKKRLIFLNEKVPIPDCAGFKSTEFNKTLLLVVFNTRLTLLGIFRSHYLKLQCRIMHHAMYTQYVREEAGQDILPGTFALLS